MWQLLGVKQIQNGGRSHGNQDAKNLNSLQTKVYPTDSDFVPLYVDVTGNITAKICEVWSEFKFFASWLPWERPPF
jgi:hypothetical protein